MENVLNQLIGDEPITVEHTIDDKTINSLLLIVSVFFLARIVSSWITKK